MGEPEENPPPFTLIRHVIFRPLGLAPAEPVAGERATFYVPRTDDHDPRRGRRLMHARPGVLRRRDGVSSTPSDLVRFAQATGIGSVDGELAGGRVLSLVSRQDDGIVVAVASNVAYAKTDVLAQAVADVFAGSAIARRRECPPDPS
ncbi:MAG: hypothetical protein R2712_03820 [Vicinamibacterales bacterium]